MSEKKAIYVQLMDSIKKKIVDGELSIGERLPSERNMSQVYGINRLTVRNALKKLEEEGILISKPQSGYYVERVPEVVEKIDLSRKGILSLSMQIKQSGMIPSRITLSLRRLKPVDAVGEFFPNEKEVYEIIRLCRIYDEPYALQFVYIPTSKFDDAERFDFESFSLYDYMADKGHRPKEVISKLSIGTISPDYYRIMHYNKNFFICEYTGFDINDEPVEYTLSYFNPKYTSFKYNIKA